MLRELHMVYCDIDELEALLKEIWEAANTLSSCVEYDYHGNVVGEEEARAIAILDKINMKGQTNDKHTTQDDHQAPTNN